MVTYTQRIFKGSSFLLVFSVIAAVLGYLIRLVLARNLTPTDYGLFYAIFAFVSFFLFFRGLGLNTALVKFIPQFKAKKDNVAIKSSISAAFSIELISTIILGVVIYALSTFLAVNYFKDIRAAFILKVFMFYIFFSMFVMLMEAMFRGFQKFKTFSIIEPVRNAVVLITIFVLLSVGMKLNAAVYAFTISWIVVALVFGYFAFKTFNFSKYKVTNKRKYMRMLLMYSLPLVFSMVGAKVIARIDTLMLTHFRTLSEVGIYNVVLPSAMILLFFADSISAITFPILSELFAKKDIKRIKTWLTLVYKYSFFFAIPILMGLFVYSELFIKLFFGANYVAGANAFKILLVGVLFLIVARSNKDILLAAGDTKIYSYVILWAAIFNIILNFLLVPKFGNVGAAIATAATFFCMLIISTTYTLKHVKVVHPWGEWIKTLIAGLLFVISLIFISGSLSINPWLELLISVPIALAIYIGICRIFKIFDVAELKHYGKLMAK